MHMRIFMSETILNYIVILNCVSNMLFIDFKLAHRFKTEIKDEVDRHMTVGVGNEESSFPL